MNQAADSPVPVDPWSRVLRSLQSASTMLGSAVTQEQCQAIGVVCRETLISLAQTVTPSKMTGLDGVEASPSDAKRRLERFIADAAPGASSDEERSFARACVNLASKVVHQRTATPREAALCVVATESAVRIMGLMSGRESPGPVLRIAFEVPGAPRMIKVSPTHLDDLPSTRHRDRLVTLLDQRRRGIKHPLDRLLPALASAMVAMGQPRPLEADSTEELEKSLKDFDPSTWREVDDYEQFEKKGLHVNLSVFNAGQQFIDDAVVVVSLPKIAGLAVAAEVQPEPYDGSVRYLRVPHIGGRSYPKREEHSDRWSFTSHVGTLRHQLSTKVFGEALRISITEVAAGATLLLTCTVYGRQLPNPVSAELLVEVDREIAPANKIIG